MTRPQAFQVGWTLALTLIAAGCAGAFGHVREDLPGGAETAPRRGVPGLSNLGRVDEGLWRSAQPTAEGFRAAKAMGVKTVVDLRGSKSDRELAGRAGLQVIAVRTSAKTLDEDDLVAFLRVATDPARRPVLVHCLAGHDRTGAAVAAYRRVVSGWTADESLAEMRAFGAAPWYPNLVALIRQLDPAAILAQVWAPSAAAAAGVRNGARSP
jgi:protein tyrosine phosphatase (PTP) superfamily phosphohydrolase (DUF442 family)